MACLIDVARAIGGTAFTWEDRYRRTGWFWFAQGVTDQMEIEARRRDQRTEQRRVDRQFTRLETDMRVLEKSLRATPNDRGRERERMASRLLVHRAQHERLVSQTRFAVRVEQELTAALENKKIVRSAVALAKIAERQAKLLTPARAETIVKRYEEARRQQLDTYTLFDGMFDAEERANDAEKNDSGNGGGGTPQKETSGAVRRVLDEFSSPSELDMSALDRQHAVLMAARAPTAAVRPFETVVEACTAERRAESAVVPRPTVVAASIEDLEASIVRRFDALREQPNESAR